MTTNVTFRQGVRLGVDVGSVRVGVARSDASGVLATPLTTLAPAELETLAALANSEDAIEVVVGLPLHLSGREGPATEKSRAFAAALAERIAPVDVRLVDERLSTVGATRGLRAAGVDSRRGRHLVDQAAAVIILQAALDFERSTGRPPGESIRAGA